MAWLLLLLDLAIFVLLLLSECAPFFIWALILVVALFFLGLALVLIFIFFELSFFPCLILILWLGDGVEKFSASLFMAILGAIFAVAYAIGIFLGSVQRSISCRSSIEAYFFFSAMFFVKLPAFLFHVWLPKAHVEAPVVLSVVLASILLKVGGGGIVKLVESLAIPSSAILLLAACGMILAPIWALASSDLKKIVAYSSVSHMAFFILGAYSSPVVGISIAFGILIFHGFVSAVLFVLVGRFAHAAGSRSLLFASASSQGSTFLAWHFLAAILMNFRVPPSVGAFVEISIFSALPPSIFLLVVGGAFHFARDVLQDFFGLGDHLEA